MIEIRCMEEVISVSTLLMTIIHNGPVTVINDDGRQLTFNDVDSLEDICERYDICDSEDITELFQ